MRVSSPPEEVGGGGTALEGLRTLPEDSSVELTAMRLGSVASERLSPASSFADAAMGIGSQITK